MEVIITFLAEVEIPIYFLLGLVGVIYLRRLSIAIDERKNSVFGLERMAAQEKVTSAVSVLALIGLLAVGEFVVATFFAGELAQKPSFATPTIAVLTTATATLPGPIPTDATPTATPYPQANIEGVESQCEAGVLEIKQPSHNASVEGVVEIMGSVNTPNFGSYTYEYSTMGEPDWQTIAAGSDVRVDASLGFWYTTNLVPGEYMLRLVALNNEGIEQAACVIIVNVVAAQ